MWILRLSRMSLLCLKSDMYLEFFVTILYYYWNLCVKEKLAYTFNLGNLPTFLWVIKFQKKYEFIFGSKDPKLVGRCQEI